MTISKEQALADGIKLLADMGYIVGEYNPHKVSAWLVQDLYAGSAICIGDCEQDALDNLCDDTDYFECLLLREGDNCNNAASLGNDSAQYDLEYTCTNLIVTA